MVTVGVNAFDEITMGAVKAFVGYIAVMLGCKFVIARNSFCVEVASNTT